MTAPALSDEVVEKLKGNPEFVRLLARMGELAQECSVAEAMTIFEEMADLVDYTQRGVAA